MTQIDIKGPWRIYKDFSEFFNEFMTEIEKHVLWDSRDPEMDWKSCLDLPEGFTDNIEPDDIISKVVSNRTAPYLVEFIVESDGCRSYWKIQRIDNIVFKNVPKGSFEEEFKND